MLAFKMRMHVNVFMCSSNWEWIPAECHCFRLNCYWLPVIWFFDFIFVVPESRQFYYVLNILYCHYHFHFRLYRDFSVLLLYWRRINSRQAVGKIFSRLLVISVHVCASVHTTWLHKFLSICTATCEQCALNTLRLFTVESRISEWRNLKRR